MIFSKTTLQFADICYRLQLTKDPLANSLIAAIAFGKGKYQTARRINDAVIDALAEAGLAPWTEKTFTECVIHWTYPADKLKEAVEPEVQTA